MDNISDTDRYLDLKGLSEYSSLGLSTLRDYLRAGGLPYFKLKGKVLIRQSEFDTWMETFRVDPKQALDAVVDGVIESLKK